VPRHSVDWLSRLNLAMQLVLESSSDDEDDEFFLGVTHVAMNADESDDEKKYCGSIHRCCGRIWW
jgi:hypothetical protein